MNGFTIVWKDCENSSCYDMERSCFGEDDYFVLLVFTDFGEGYNQLDELIKA